LKEIICYGLPELNKANKNANYIANPGCFYCNPVGFFAAADGLLNNDVHINATTGSTGAGVSIRNYTFWRSNMSRITKHLIISTW
jgi:N-acetyl-gamma-glutamyl-phosphate reductase